MAKNLCSIHQFQKAFNLAGRVIPASKWLNYSHESLMCAVSPPFVLVTGVYTPMQSSFVNIQLKYFKIHLNDTKLIKKKRPYLPLCYSWRRQN